MALPLLGSCVVQEPETAPAPVLAPVIPDREIRIGVVVNARDATIASNGGLRIVDPDEGDLGAAEPGASINVSLRGAGVAVLIDGQRTSRRSLRLEPADSTEPIRINGREYHGAVELVHDDAGITVVNRVSLERYLVGVVAAEMGNRTVSELEALKAQAIVSRTYAVKNSGRFKDHGYDLAATVNDQVYSGRGDDSSLAAMAVRVTRGQIVTYDNQPIDAFFSSTCGGETEEGTAAFAGASRPYLHAVSDVDGSGVPYCAISPRFHWTAEWNSRELATTLRRTLAAEQLPATRANDLTTVRVAHRDGSDRVTSLELVGKGGVTAIAGQAIRRVLATPDGILRSSDFTVRTSRTGGRLERVTIEGTGNGHGVGMCQWGAIGRARVGQDARTILQSYFPGTDIGRLY